MRAKKTYVMGMGSHWQLPVVITLRGRKLWLSVVVIRAGA